MERVDKILGYIATPQKIMTRYIVVAGHKAALLFNPDISDSETIRTVIFALENYKKDNSKSPISALDDINNGSFVPDKSTNKDINNDGMQAGKAAINAGNQAEPLLMEALLQSHVYASEAKLKESEVMDDLLSGDTVVIVDKAEGYMVVATRKWDKRAVSEPPSETVLKGPREGFVEDVRTNLSLLERRLTTPAFAVEKIKLGRLSSTTVALCYISTVADRKFVNRIRKKLKSINIDAVLDSSYLQSLIEPHPYSIFHQTGTTEKPDVAAAKMLEGRVAIVVDGSPTVLTAPFLLIEDFQASDDYYKRSVFVGFLRALRYVSLFFAIFLPGFYVAVQVFHFSIIPLKLLITLLNAVEGIPLAPLPEMLFVLLLFEIIREASVRMPRAVGMAMSIVGALVLGETAVKSGMISSPAIMIVALSSLALYTTPNDVGIISMLRLAFIVLGGIGGIYALTLGVLFTLAFLVNFDSFGTPYLAPFAPLVFNDLKDSIYRSPIRDMRSRPLSIPNINKTRKS